jgi:Tol biopolymer transport system component
MEHFEIGFPDGSNTRDGRWWIREAAISPNGEKIAYTFHVDLEETSPDYQGIWGPYLYLSNVDGSELTRVTEFPAFQISWSPDGSLLAFSGFWVDQMEYLKLTATETQPPPSTFYSEIYLIDAKGRNLRAITSNSQSCDFPIWSPDNSRIAFLSTVDKVKCQNSEYECNEIYIIYIDGTGQTRITNDYINHAILAWIP